MKNRKPPPWFDTFAPDRRPQVMPKPDPDGDRAEKIMKLKAKIRRLQNVLDDAEGAD